ncbi:MAG: DEAD/DEAH box helicase [Desulfobacula sp.]|jgi:ATP-dependent helicase Lhr and Lhr-like helicase|uniref:DEAD/DEAH box helicase n=1 Tax=Desulfobacula sp. TaxID=2593537 RepID=UPI001D592169|nr:DEAD/DEAH box helicase [Desulfobacteraceae bacterium]MBT3804228.1 DEAD/DEAH box helicase [Desulfobacula sp.]MBT5546122.1 DEAD/DEAH box helicase [Desulfobacula sp.]MBT5972677.1 DEAD/DEAH box helicase [Desulfobacula sp.]
MATKHLSKQMPDAWSIFFKKRKPRLLQDQAMPLLIQGKSVLLSGPTASGKTEAAVTPLLQRHISFKRQQVSVIYIAPTKALVNDIYHRLDSYLCARIPESVRRYTGDHHDFKDPKGLFLLITTPEALDSLQLMRPESLAGVRAVVVDEIHMLHGNARGQQLRHVINRIEKNVVKPQNPKDVFQKIGMTATLQDMKNVSKIWLGKKAKIIKAGEPRDIDITYLQVSVPEGSEKAAESSNVIANWFEETGTAKGLIFGNTRNKTQVLAANLHENLRGSRWPVHWHTGIITASERERVEDAMKNERFGICVATATLEVGIDIGDLDIIILADPPYSINAFLQRIGRGNRESDICKVVALYATEQELTLFHALHHCASTGTLDEIHEYDRAAVRFQQIVSFAWHGANQDKPLTKKNLSTRTCDTGNGSVVEDMLETGSLKDIHGALLLSLELTDQGERRQIHTTITGARTLNMVDSSSGETMISASGQEITQGALFVGGKIKNVTSNVDGTVSLESTRGKRLPLTSLPATRGKRGLGRRIIWALAEMGDHDPHSWEYEGNRIITWGGADYNRLLTIILKMEGITSNAQPDEYGINGIPDGAEITPSQILEWTQLIQQSESLPAKGISQFCERSRYFSYLSSEMQEKEAQRSVPFQGFIKWLQECLAIPEENIFS